MKYIKYYDFKNSTKLTEELDKILSETKYAHLDNKTIELLNSKLSLLKKKYSESLYDNIFQDFFKKYYTNRLSYSIVTIDNNEKKLNAVKYYINKGADVNYDGWGDWKYPTLMLAIMNYKAGENEEIPLKIVNELINAGADLRYELSINSPSCSSTSCSTDSELPYTCNHFLLIGVENNYIGLVKDLIKKHNVELGDILFHMVLDNTNNSREMELVVKKQKMILDILIKSGASWIIKDQGKLHDFYDKLSNENKIYVEKKYPVQYEQYLMEKEAERYNL